MFVAKKNKKNRKKKCDNIKFSNAEFVAGIWEVKLYVAHMHDKCIMCTLQSNYPNPDTMWYEHDRIIYDFRLDNADVIRIWLKLDDFDSISSRH